MAALCTRLNALTERCAMFRFASYKQAETDLPKFGFSSIGSGMYRQAHDLWQLSKMGDGFALMRVAAEPEVFPEDEVHEAPGDRENLKQGCVDRYGVPVQIGQLVHYSLGGESVSGRVARAERGYLDVRLTNQLDSGVPADMVMVDRQAQLDPIEPPRESPIHDVDKQDKDNMGLHINPEKAAAFIGDFFSTYGAVLADSFQKILPKHTVEAMNALGDLRTARQATRTASWGSLEKFAGVGVADSVRKLVASGIEARRISKKHNVPFAVAAALRTEIASLPKDKVGLVLKAARKIEKVDDEHFSVIAKATEPRVAAAIARPILEYKIGKLQKTAVDDTAKDYWRAYFGDYGDQWVREIKRRVKADLMRAILVKQGVDDTAAEYWSDYFGDYGDALVDEVDRSVKEKSKVEAARKPMNSDATPMTLPQPVAKHDVFANTHIVAEESWGSNNRVALAVSGGVYQVLVRSGNAQKKVTAASQKEAIETYRKAVWAHCGV